MFFLKVHGWLLRRPVIARLILLWQVIDLYVSEVCRSTEPTSDGIGATPTLTPAAHLVCNLPILVSATAVEWGWGTVVPLPPLPSSPIPWIGITEIIRYYHQLIHFRIASSSTSNHDHFLILLQHFSFLKCLPIFFGFLRWSEPSVAGEFRVILIITILVMWLH